MSDNDRNKSIGVFDSGLGGLTVLSPLIQILPHESSVYLGDLARTPYGDKPTEEIKRYAAECVDFFAGRDIKALIVACNSASSVAIPEILSHVNIPVFDVITPGARLAARLSRNRSVAVVGTSATIRSEAYVRELKSSDIDLTVFQTDCPALVPLIESGVSEVTPYIEAVRECLRKIPLQDIDTLILGCTHYPLISEVFRAVCGDDIRLIDSGVACAEAVEIELRELDLLADEEATVTHEYFVTGDNTAEGENGFRQKAQRFLGMDVPEVKVIRLREISESKSASTRIKS